VQLYRTPDDFLDTPLGARLAARIPRRVLVKALVAASGEADTICLRTLGACGLTTLTAPAAVGDTTIQVASVLGFAANTSGAVAIGAGSGLGGGGLGENGRAIAVAGTRVAPTGWDDPSGLYPGTIALATPLAAVYPAGAPVLGRYVERRTARGRKLTGGDDAAAASQEGQMAAAHAPGGYGAGDNVRKIFLRQAPVSQILGVAVVQSYGSTPNPLGVANLYLDPSQGWYRVPGGTYLPRGADVITTYTAGYTYVPDDVADAVDLLAAAILARGAGPRALNAVETRQGDRALKAAVRDDPAGRGPLTLEARTALQRYVRRII